MAGVVNLPEQTFKKLNTYILPQWKACFFTAMLVGIFAHIYKITNWLPNWDSLVFRYDAQNMIGLGRWFLPVVCSVSSFYDLPFLNGFIAILFHALGAVCICRMFRIEKNITAALIGAVIVTFPTVTSVMMYSYVADGYGIAFFLSALSAQFMTAEKPKFMLAAVLIAFSAGIYQAYITVTIMLCLLFLIDELIFKKASFKAVLKKALFMLLTGVLGMALYSIILKVLLSVFAVNLLDYQGVGSSLSLSNIDLMASLYVVKETFIKCFFDVSSGVRVYVILNTALLIFTLLYYIKGLFEFKVYKKIENLFMLLILTIFLPCGAAALAFINAGVDYHNLMLMGYAVFYLFFILLYERSTEENEKHRCKKCWIVLLLSLFVIFNQVLTANVSYHKAQIAYEKSYGVLVRIADRIDVAAGSENCDKILVIGALRDSDAYSANLPPEITGVTDGYIIRKDDEIVGQSVLTSALNDYCGKNFAFISGEEKKAFLQREDVKSMGIWPEENCVQVVEDTVIIKLGTEGE